MALLEVKHVSKNYVTGKTTFQALKDVSLNLFKGEILSLLGVNGAGKSTLSGIIGTLHPPTTGDVLFNGISIYHDVPEYRMHVGFCPQHPNLNSLLTVEQNLYFAGLAYRLSTKEAADRTQKLLSTFNLTNYAQRKPLTLSGGYQQRVMLARTLIHNPAIVLLDEPTVGLDPHIRYELWDYITLLRDTGTSIVLTTHYIEEAEKLSDRVCVLDKGVIKLVGSPQSLKSDFTKTTLESVFIELTKGE